MTCINNETEEKAGPEAGLLELEDLGCRSPVSIRRTLATRCG